MIYLLFLSFFLSAKLKNKTVNTKSDYIFSDLMCRELQIGKNLFKDYVKKGREDNNLVDCSLMKKKTGHALQC